jgi:hypothetical protein
MRLEPFEVSGSTRATSPIDQPMWRRTATRCLTAGRVAVRRHPSHRAFGGERRPRAQPGLAGPRPTTATALGSERRAARRTGKCRAHDRMRHGACVVRRRSQAALMLDIRALRGPPRYRGGTPSPARGRRTRCRRHQRPDGRQGRNMRSRFRARAVLGHSSAFPGVGAPSAPLAALYQGVVRRVAGRRLDVWRRSGS